MDTFTLKSGTNKGNRRIWIEGSRLLDAGLVKGTALTRVMEDADIGPDTMTLTTVENHKGKRHTIAGNDARPILDLCGKWVTDFMGDHTHFEVKVIHRTYADVTLRITPTTI